MHKDLFNHKIIYKFRETINSDSLIGFDPVMTKILAQRGIKKKSDHDPLSSLMPYHDLKGIDKACDILMDAFKTKQKICIVADYDVDGATSCAIGVKGFQMLGFQVDYIVPNRFKHGYGLTVSVVDLVHEQKNPDIIVTVDNGISSFDGIDHAHKKGIKVIVTDHHLAPEKGIPDADALVNPNQPGDEFQSKNLAGCGVIFYVLTALRQRMISEGLFKDRIAPNIMSLLDLVAIGTVADLVKLDHNNRTMVYWGLQLIRSEKTRPGILALIDIIKKDPAKLSTSDIGFGIAPRINAAGRMEDMTIGIQCLLAQSMTKAVEYANKLNDINIQRKDTERKMKEQLFDEPEIISGQYCRVAYHKNFHEGVIGIVASRLKDIDYLPTIVFANEHDPQFIKGSGRSINEIHLRDVLDYISKKDSSIIIKFGGHAMAAGLTIRKEKLEEFVRLFDEAVFFFLKGDVVLVNNKWIDIDLHGSQINEDLVDAIDRNIWGQAFPSPLFAGKFKIISQKILKEQHLKCIVEKDGVQFDALWFFHNQMFETNSIHLVYTLNKNTYNGNTSVQLLVDGCY